MEQYIPHLLSFLGGSAFLAVLNHLLNKRQRGLQNDGLRDDQTAKWRDSSLDISKALLESNTKQIELERRLARCEEKIADCDCGGIKSYERKESKG